MLSPYYFTIYRYQPSPCPLPCIRLCIPPQYLYGIRPISIEPLPAACLSSTSTCELQILPFLPASFRYVLLTKKNTHYLALGYEVVPAVLLKKQYSKRQKAGYGGSDRGIHKLLHLYCHVYMLRSIGIQTYRNYTSRICTCHMICLMS